MTGSGNARRRITGLILAGGRGSRMAGKDKGLVSLTGRPMIARVLAALAPQVERIVINANRNTELYSDFGCDTVADMHGGYPGPLAGMAAGLAVTHTRWMLTVPCDAPLLPGDLASRLYQTALRRDAQIVIPDDGQRTHPVFALIDVDLAASLDAFLAGEERKVLRWMRGHRLAVVDYSDRSECFVNVNTAEELAGLEARLAGRAAAR